VRRAAATDEMWLKPMGTGTGQRFQGDLKPTADGPIRLLAVISNPRQAHGQALWSFWQGSSAGNPLVSMRPRAGAADRSLFSIDNGPNPSSTLWHTLAAPAALAPVPRK